MCHAKASVGRNSRYCVNRYIIPNLYPQLLRQFPEPTAIVKARASQLQPHRPGLATHPQPGFIHRYNPRPARRQSSPHRPARRQSSPHRPPQPLQISPTGDLIHPRAQQPQSPFHSPMAQAQGIQHSQEGGKGLTAPGPAYSRRPGRSGFTANRAPLALGSDAFDMHISQSTLPPPAPLLPGLTATTGTPLRRDGLGRDTLPG